MTKPLDPEEKRKRAILTRMSNQGRRGDYLSLLREQSEANYQDALQVEERMMQAYDRRHKRG